MVLPSVFLGYSTDDHWLREELAGADYRPGLGKPPFDLFRWFDASRVQHLVDRGTLPWWTHPQAFMAFMRPLTSLTHTLDHALWPDSALAMHLHNLFWFGCLLVVARRAYVEICSRRWVAGVATTFFALSGAHGVAVGWIANRSALLGATFGTLALLCHHRWRTADNPRYSIAAAASLSLALMSTEAGVSSGCYLLAYALLFERGAKQRRLASLGTYAVVLAVWFYLRLAGRYGTYGMGGYIDPLHQPFAFLAALPERMLVIFASQLAGFSADVYVWARDPYKLPILLFLTVGIGLAVWWGSRALCEHREIRFFAGGSILAALPLVAALPSDRLLSSIGFGVMPFLAHGLHYNLQPPEIASRVARVRYGLGITVSGVHLVISPLVLATNAIVPAIFESMVIEAERGAPSDVALHDQALIVAKLPESIRLSYLPSIRMLRGEPRPDRMYWLVATNAPVSFERIGNRTLRVRCDDGLFDDYWIDRSSALPLRVGEEMRLGEFTVRILAVTSDGRPTLADFQFERSLESARYRWIAWEGRGFEPFEVPALDGSQLRAARDVDRPRHDR